MSCGVGHRRSLDRVLLGLWCRPAGVAPIRPLAWAPPYAASVALKSLKKTKTKTKTLLLLVCFSSHSEMPPFSGLNNRKYFLTVVEAGSLRSQCQQGWFLLRPLSLACTWPSSPHVPTGHPSVCLCPNPLLIRTPVMPDGDPPCRPSFSLVTSSKTLTPNPVTF